MTLIPLPSGWAELTAQGARYELLNRVKEISEITADQFYNSIDVIGLDDFIQDRYMQEPKAMIGKVLFEDEEEKVKDYVKVLFSVSDFYPGQAPKERIEPLIQASKKLYRFLAQRGAI